MGTLQRSRSSASSRADLLRPNDVARLLSVSRAWVYEAARTGRIPSFRLGGEDGPLRFVAEDIERWLAGAGCPAETTAHGQRPRRNIPRTRPVPRAAQSSR